MTWGTYVSINVQGAVIPRTERFLWAQQRSDLRETAKDPGRDYLKRDLYRHLKFKGQHKGSKPLREPFGFFVLIKAIKKCGRKVKLNAHRENVMYGF